MVASGLAEDLELFYQLCGNVANDGTRPSLEADESRRLRRAYESLSTDLNPHPIHRDKTIRECQQASLRRQMAGFLSAIFVVMPNWDK